MRVAALTAVLLLLAAPVAAGPREDALARLIDREDVEARRLGAFVLAEAGTMADVPALLGALRDADARVRELAERALWGVWSRSGQPDVDLLFQAGVSDDLRAKIDGLIAERVAARAAKDWAAADRIRAELTALNVEVMDNPTGATWRIKEQA